MELGYGLDLAACAVTGATEGLAFVSPKTARAVSDTAAGLWRERLLPLPALLLNTEQGNTQGGLVGDAAQWEQGLRLTGHFLARDVFGLQHKPLPASRVALYDRVASLKDSPRCLTT